MVVFGAAPGLVAKVLGIFLQSGAGGTYRRKFVTGAAPSAWVGGPGDPPQPVGTRGAGYDPTEGAIVDSTVDAGTGFAGAYGPALYVSCVIRRSNTQTPFGRYGLQLNEAETYGYFLASEVVPARGDLFVSADGQRYVVGEDIRPMSVVDTIVGYAAQLERRDPTDPVYTA